MMNKVHVIGIGPGAEDYLVPIAKTVIENSDCLIGGRRALSAFQHLDKEKIYLEGHFKDVRGYIKKNRNKKKIAVLVSGDPGLYSFLEGLKETLNKEDYAVIPGISAMQIAFARIGETWQDAKIISLHGRKRADLAKEVEAHPKIFLFTDSRFPPDRIAAHLLDKGMEDRRVIVFEELTYPDERVIDTDIKSLSKMKPAGDGKTQTGKDRISDGARGFGLCVMIIKK